MYFINASLGYFRGVRSVNANVYWPTTPYSGILWCRMIKERCINNSLVISSIEVFKKQTVENKTTGADSVGG